MVVIQIVQFGRTGAQKRALYRELADRLHDRLSLREEDLIVTIAENTYADWLFGDDREHRRDGSW